MTDQSKEIVQFIEFIQIVTKAEMESEELSSEELLFKLRKSTDATEKVTLIDKVLEKSL